MSDKVIRDPEGKEVATIEDRGAPPRSYQSADDAKLDEWTAKIGGGTGAVLGGVLGAAAGWEAGGVGGLLLGVILGGLAGGVGGALFAFFVVRVVLPIAILGGVGYLVFKFFQLLWGVGKG